jgi:hypothetical protein
MKVFFYFVFFASFVLIIYFIYNKLKSKNKFLSIFFIVFSIFLGLIFYTNKRKIYNAIKLYFKEIKNTTKSGNCETTIYTLNLHKDSYPLYHRPLAIKTTNNGYILNQQVLRNYINKGRIVEIDENDGYYIKPLEHSSKHLTPLAYRRLKELGLLFRSYITLENEKKSYFIISSVTRDEKQQAEVRESNRKTATENLSTHSFGVSFDISGIKSINNSCNDCSEALSMALTKMQQEGKILICSESVCIHITVIK